MADKLTRIAIINSDKVSYHAEGHSIKTLTNK